MEHTAINNKELIISGTEDGFEYVKMLVPENWTSTINNYPDIYAGYSYPYVFTVTNTSPDRTAAIHFYSHRGFLDDHLKDFSNYTQDDYGNLLNHFKEAEDYLDAVARNAIGKYEGFTFLKQYDCTNAEYAKSRKEKKMAKADEDGENFNWHYFKRIVRIYAYSYNGHSRRRAYSLIVEGTDTTRWSYVPDYGMSMMDPFMKETMKSVFPNFQYDRNSGRYIYSSMSETYWEARQLMSLDCLENDFDYLYEQAFRPLSAQGVTICDDLWEQFRIKREGNEARNRQLREDKKQAAEIQRKANEQRREANRSLYESIRKTQQETHDLINSSYENHKKTQNKVSEMWSDAILGNTRFLDKDGKEHVLHTYDQYAYKKGDDYISSDSPLDRPFGWEELEKKKY